MRTLQFKLLWSISLILITITSKAQQTGIQFMSGVTWEQLLEKAKLEHKYIFLDCYATWCGPCKYMDKEVYTRTDVGEALNDYYVSVKVQMDQAAKDDMLTKSWYSTAAMIAKMYNVAVYPTFLFIDPNGKLLHNVTGAIDAKSFINLANSAREADKQASEVLAHLQPNTLDTLEEKVLINLFKTSDQKLAGKIAADYLSRIPFVELSKKRNGILMVEFQNEPKVTAIALKFIQQGGVKNNLGFIRALCKQPSVAAWALTYISNLSNAQIVKRENLQLIVDFKSNASVSTWSENNIRTHLLSDTVSQQIALIFNDDPIVKRYVNEYIDHLPKEELFLKSNIALAHTFTDSLGGRSFDLFYKNGKKVDTIMHNEGYSTGVINRLIGITYITPAVNSGKTSHTEPDWNDLDIRIKKQLGKRYTGDNIVYARMKWCLYKKDGPGCAKFMVKWMDKIYREKGVAGSQLSPSLFWNQNIYNVIFQYDLRKGDLKKALIWMNDVNRLQRQPNPFLLDTEASLLYKLGRFERAIAIEKMAVQFGSMNAGLTDNLNKMQKGQPTWSLHNTMPN